MTRRVICNSKMYWAKNCPHKTNIKLINVAETISDDDNYDEVSIILMTSEYEILINEMEVNAIIDTACTKTVSGKNWFHNFLKCLDTAFNRVKIVSSEKVFSTFQAIISAKIVSTDCFIKTEIVNKKIPLLLYKSNLKKT